MRPIVDVLTIDTETTVDHTQRLTYGAAATHILQRSDTGQIQAVKQFEWLFYGDDLPARAPHQLDVLCRYAARHGVELLSQREFIDEILWDCVHSDYTVVGYNLAFDIARIAYGYGSTARKGEKGFSFCLWGRYEHGVWRDHPWRPRVTVRRLGSNSRAFRFTTPSKRPRVHARMLDVAQLSFALTDRRLPLKAATPIGASACGLWGIHHRTGASVEHGVVTFAHIDYCRADVDATADLAAATIEELERHPIVLCPTEAYTPASLGKAHYRAMGLRPTLAQFAGFDRARLGEAMAAYFGGRSELRVRHHPVPVVVVDFLSQYPSACILLDVWHYLSAESLDVVDCRDDLLEFLRRVADEGVAAVLDKDAWKTFVGIATVHADGDLIAPIRGNFDTHAKSPASYLTAVARQTADAPRTITIPDLVASVLLTGQIPRVDSAWRLVANSRYPRLNEVEFPGAGTIDPYRDNPYARWIELRQRIKRDPDLDDATRTRLSQALKIIANSTAYGVLAQCTQKHGTPGTMHVYTDRDAWDEPVDAIEQFGEFAFPPLAAVITGGGRLMLAIAERMVRDRGGVFAFCDTDSMGIVATPTSRFVACPHGDTIDDQGTQGVVSLSYADVQDIVDAFDALHPYDRQAVPGAFLEVEDYCTNDDGEVAHATFFGISSKRYVLFRTVDQTRQLVKSSAHGIGDLMPATHLGDRTVWLEEIWQYTLRRVLDGDQSKPDWIHRLWVKKTPVNTPHVAGLLDGINADLPYSEQIKPYGFVLFTHLELGNLSMIAPFSTNPDTWESATWLDIQTRRPCEFFTLPGDVNPGSDVEEDGEEEAIDAIPDGAVLSVPLGVITYDRHVAAWMANPERKFTDGDGKPCDRTTAGLLYRKHVHVASAIVEHVGRGTLPSEKDTTTEADLNPGASALYGRREERIWTDLVLPTIRALGPAAFAHRLGVEKSTVSRWLAGARRPWPSSRNRVLSCIKAELQAWRPSISHDVNVLMVDFVRLNEATLGRGS